MTTTYYLDPDTTESQTLLNTIGPGNEDIDDGDRQPDNPVGDGLSVYAAFNTGTKDGLYGCESFTLLGGVAVVSVTVWATVWRGTGGTAPNYKVSVYKAGSEMSAHSYTAIASDATLLAPKLVSYTWSSGPLTQGDIDDLQVHLEIGTSADEGGGFGCAYLEVVTDAIVYEGAADVTISVASGVAHVVSGVENVIVVNKSTGSATTIFLPSSPVAGRTIIVKDGKGDAAANNITVTPAAGNIDGAGTNVISTNYGSVRFVYNGTQWNVVG